MVVKYYEFPELNDNIDKCAENEIIETDQEATESKVTVSSGETVTVNYDTPPQILDEYNNIFKSNTTLICRSHFSNMMFSHIFMIIPCVWWIYIDAPNTTETVYYSKLMAIIMTAAIIFSYLYHYYYECILCYTEQTYMAFAIISLNIYMYLRNVSIIYILPGGIFLFALKTSLKICNSKTREFYDTYHPICHYIAASYIYYCVWHLRNAQQNIGGAASTSVIFNDIYSGVNYHTLHK